MWNLRNMLNTSRTWIIMVVSAHKTNQCRWLKRAARVDRRRQSWWRIWGLQSMNINTYMYLASRIWEHQYSKIYVFIFEKAGMLSKDVRMIAIIKSSQRFFAFLLRIFMGKNKIAQVALGRTPEDEFKDNLRHLSTVSTKNTLKN